jgi:hypothetical protein
MVPEVEYQALLNMLKGNDELGYDKAQVDTKIQQILKDPKITPLVKGKKYDWLVKQKQNISKNIDERASRPQKVEIDKEQIKSILNDISKYLGVAPTTTQQQQDPSTSNLSPSQKKRQKRKERAQKTPDQSKYEEDDEEETEETPESSYIVHPNYRDDLMKIVKQNRSKLKLNKDGELIDPMECR